ncbi:MAG TPA: phospho-N-acetylmuramoyl-pentapeptide-transferase, partial [Lachnospiraceae bacterium]|nr:phospho-N-acetylmuramoyl-pentapeptide-transferase [Lachnospiraceae bacterium]
MKKQGTPTMGGIIWMLALLLVSLIFAGRVKEGWIVIIMTFAFGLIGLLDDMLKEVFK